MKKERKKVCVNNGQLGLCTPNSTPMTRRENKITKNIFFPKLNLIYNMDKNCVANKESEEITGEALDQDPAEVDQLGQESNLPLIHPTQHQGCKQKC